MGETTAAGAGDDSASADRAALAREPDAEATERADDGESLGAPAADETEHPRADDSRPLEEPTPPTSSRRGWWQKPKS